jgi:hypothetical protein
MYPLSALRSHPNVIPSVLLEFRDPNRRLPPGYTPLNASDFGAPGGFTGLDSFKNYTKSVGYGNPGWNTVLQVLGRAMAQIAVDWFVYYGVTRGSGRFGNGEYEGVFLFAAPGVAWYNDNPDQPYTDTYSDVANLFAHALDGGTGTSNGSWTGPGTGIYPDNVDVLSPSEFVFNLPSGPSPAFTGLRNINAARYTPWCQNGIAEARILIDTFASEYATRRIAANVCIPAEIGLDLEQPVNHFTLASAGAPGYVQKGSVNNLRADPKYATAIVYEWQATPGGAYTPKTYQEHWALFQTLDAEFAAMQSVQNGFGTPTYAPYRDQFNRAFGVDNVSVSARALFRQHEALFAYAYDYALHQGWYSRWKAVFPGTKCSNYGMVYSPRSQSKAQAIGDQLVSYDVLQADFSAPTCYPTGDPSSADARYNPEDFPNVSERYLSWVHDVVSNCFTGVNGREVRLWSKLSNAYSEVYSGLPWSPDAFGRMTYRLADVGSNAYYLWNHISNDASNDAAHVACIESALQYGNRYVRGSELAGVGKIRRT